MKMRNHKPVGESGYMLLSVMLLVTLMLIGLSIELPRIGQQIKREKEDELIHRGQEYQRAIRKYFRKYGQYPVSLDQLEKANNMRFLRKRYKDPFTGKDDWQLLHQQDIKLIPTAGTASGAVSGGTGQITSSIGQAAGTQGSTAGLSPMGSSIGLPPGQFNAPQSGSQFGSIGQPSSGFGSSGGTSSTFGATPSAGAQPGQPGTDPNASGANTSGITAAGNMPGASPLGSGAGVGPILGVASTSKLQSIKVMDGKDHYNDWQFWFNPNDDKLGVNPGAGAGAVGTPAAGLGAGTSASPGPGTAPQSPTAGPGMGPSRISQ